ncbi:MAG: S-methyl-5'-thioadenosine phosphorylase [Candidatus Marinimicrobia bacterium]|nr:S-methyl-5'-thioadenosine phosphorylase [Candidatus Neomarinimicrobiota bacterium]MCF7839390.1 S-methyl-5'-thioadenosine phosphorylase [Candidatus Neomarinimicrobiota bacterium]
MHDQRIGIIGGTGLYELPGFEKIDEQTITTAFGEPSAPLKIFKSGEKEVVFLPRHGEKHHLLPTELNHRANIMALKMLDVKWLMGVSAVGSFKEELPPQTMVFVDQFIDRTRSVQTYFGNGIIGHVGFAHPTEPALAKILAECATQLGIRHQLGGTYVNMAGPAFSTVAESRLYKSWGADVVGMTALAEAKLSREAEIAYAPIAMVTDFDAWHPEHDAVSVEMVVQNLQANSANAKKLLTRFLEVFDPNDADYPSHHSLDGALMTAIEDIPPATRKNLEPILRRFLTS